MATQLLKENQDKYMFSKRKFSSKVLMCSDGYDMLIGSINVSHWHTKKIKER